MDMIDPIQMTHNKYYIGYYTLLDYQNNELIMVNKIHPKTFMKFNSTLISKYFYWYSGMAFSKKPSTDILQLQIDQYDSYTVIVKTFWIKIIQRTWKRVYAERKKFIEYRRKLTTIRDYELGIRKPIERYLGLYGLLTVYNNY